MTVAELELDLPGGASGVGDRGQHDPAPPGPALPHPEHYLASLGLQMQRR